MKHNKKLIYLLSVFFILLVEKTHATLPNDKFPCGKEVDFISKQLGALQQWKSRSTPTEKSLWTSPTDKIGTWVLLRSGVQQIMVSQVSLSKTIHINFSEPQCIPEIVVPKFEKKIEFQNEFSDLDLLRILNKHKTGFIYIWSPRMPLSIEGLVAFKQALIGTKHRLIVLVDPNNKMPIHDFSYGGKITPWDTQKLASAELIFRSSQTHYPAILYFRNGKIHPIIKYGYENLNQYKLDIREYENSQF